MKDKRKREGAEKNRIGEEVDGGRLRAGQSEKNGKGNRERVAGGEGSVKWEEGAPCGGRGRTEGEILKVVEHVEKKAVQAPRRYVGTYEEGLVERS